jgi:N-acetylmuramic acid 6-phosphate etherase
MPGGASASLGAVKTNAWILGVESGGTKTSALLVDGGGRVVARAEAGACNLKLSDDAAVTRVMRQVKRQLPSRPSRIAWCGAGVRTERDRRRALALLAQVWPGTPALAASDRESGLLAGCGGAEGILVIAGTGSNAFGCNARGQVERVGGHGQLLSDAGSGYDVARGGLRAVFAAWDQTRRWPALGARFLRAMGLNDPEQLVDWSVTAGKGEVAALAPEVFAAWRARDWLAGRVIAEAARELSASAVLVARRLGYRRNQAFPVCLKGGLFERQPGYFKMVAAQIRRVFPKAKLTLPRFEGAWGAVMMARGSGFRVQGSADTASEAVPRDSATLASALTEQRNPRTMRLDRLGVPQLVETMLVEDARVVPAIRQRKREIERAVELIVNAFRRGGRLFYIGAGTSGRLGVLDASECPPTFSIDPEMVQGIIAGGAVALQRSVEAAEDDATAGAEALKFRGVRRGDVVAGIAASGRTPFVLGALAAARRLGASTVFLNFNPAFCWPREHGAPPDVTISVATGPEVVTGSTRLKAGTATKLILNMFTTLAMVRLGKVVGNLMVDVDPTCAKLRDRATRIVSALTGAGYDAARRRLEAAGWVVKDALRPVKASRRTSR